MDPTLDISDFCDDSYAIVAAHGGTKPKDTWDINVSQEPQALLHQ